MRQLLAGLAVAGLLGFSSYTAFMTRNLGLQKATEPQLLAKPLEKRVNEGENQSPAETPDPGLSRMDPRSGAVVQRVTTPDGKVVTQYAPRPRDGEGPLLIGTDIRGQDPRMAAYPNENLLEETPLGRLPVIGDGGLRAMDHYARPWSGARGTRVAIVVGGLGLSQTGTQKAIKTLPDDITLAFASSGNSLQRWMQDARRDGHEILLQVPFEPFDYPANNPGPDTLLTRSSAKENLKRLHEAMGRITNYTGIVNYLGGRYMADADALEPILRDIGKRGLLFLDDGSAGQSLTAKIGKAIGAPHGFSDVLLDGQVNEQAILSKLDELERIARRNGSAIGIASAFDESIAAIGKWSIEASRRGIEIVGVSALVSDPQPQ